MNIPYSKDVIEKVVNFQGEDMLKAVSMYSEIEISGIGLLYVAQGKLKNRIATAERGLAACIQKNEETPSEDMEGKIRMFTNKIEYLKTKLKCQS